MLEKTISIDEDDGCERSSIEELRIGFDSGGRYVRTINEDRIRLRRTICDDVIQSMRIIGENMIQLTRMIDEDVIRFDSIRRTTDEDAIRLKRAVE